MKLKSLTPPIFLEPPEIPKEVIHLQQPSTKWCLENDPSIPFVIEGDPVAVHNANTISERVGLRVFDISDWIKHFALRSQRQFSHFYRQDKTPLIGEFQDSSVSMDAKERASQAFRFTPAADVSQDEVKRRAVGLVPYETKQVEWRKLSYWQALIHRFKGGEVKRD